MELETQLGGILRITLALKNPLCSGFNKFLNLGVNLNDSLRKKCNLRYL